MASRCTILAMLVFGSLTIPTACGDESGTSTTQSNPAPGEVTRETPRPAEEYPGLFAEAKEVCAIRPHRKVADNVGSKSTRPADIARTLAGGYKPKLRREAYRGCLAGLRDPPPP